MPFCVSESEYISNSNLYDVVSGPHADCSACPDLGGITPAGLNVDVQLAPQIGLGIGVSVNFQEVSSGGVTFLSRIDTQHEDVPLYIIDTTSSNAGEVLLVFSFPQDVTEEDFLAFKVFDLTYYHLEELSSSRDYGQRRITATIRSSGSLGALSDPTGYVMKRWPMVFTWKPGVLSQMDRYVCPEGMETCLSSPVADPQKDFSDVAWDNVVEWFKMGRLSPSNGQLAVVLDCRARCGGVSNFTFPGPGKYVEGNSDFPEGRSVCECVCPENKDYCFYPSLESPDWGDTACELPCPTDSTKARVDPNPGNPGRRFHPNWKEIPHSGRYPSCDCECNDTSKKWDRTWRRCKEDPSVSPDCEYCINGVTWDCDKENLCEYGGMGMFGNIATKFVKTLYDEGLPTEGYSCGCDFLVPHYDGCIHPITMPCMDLPSSSSS